MTIDFESVRRAIGERKLADWVLSARSHRAVSIADSNLGSRWRSHDGERFRILVRRDLPSGRGSGVVESEDRSGDPRLVVAQAVARAEAAIEPAWSTPPAAAPARVSLLDPIASASLETAARALTSALQRATQNTGVELVSSQLNSARSEVVLSSAQGFNVSWQESWFDVIATVRRDDQAAVVRRSARRISDLDLPAAMALAAQQLALPAEVDTAPSSEVLLELAVDAMLSDDDRGIWHAITDEADARAARRGLTRYQAGETIVAADAIGEHPLLVISDGALPFGTRSAPVGDEGEAVRRFQLLSNGVMGDPGMGPQDAAMRGAAPNGGVRNLVVNAGPDGSAGTVSAPILEVLRLRWQQIDPANGFAEAEIALAIDRDSGKPVRSGRFAIDLLLALTTAERSPTLVRRGSYLGPSWIRLGPLRLR